MNIYSGFTKKGKTKKKFAVLIDPDKISKKKLNEVIEIATKSAVDYFFVGVAFLPTINSMKP